MSLGVAAHAASPLSLVRVNLPAGDRSFPEPPGSEAADTNCFFCHSVGLVLNQPALAKVAWEAEVKKMRNVYKAPIAPQAVGAIVDYLVTIKGPKARALVEAACCAGRVDTGL
jgi:hypothetical protein